MVPSLQLLEGIRWLASRLQIGNIHLVKPKWAGFHLWEEDGTFWTTLILAHAEGPTNSRDIPGVSGPDKMSTSFPAFFIKQLSIQAVLILENTNQDSSLRAKMASDSL